MASDLPNVLFLCSANIARSQMAEAILRREAPDRFNAQSAGLQPKSEIHPLTRKVLEEIDIDTSNLKPKGIEEFLGKLAIHHAIIVCQTAQETCPRLYPFALHTHYWPFEDPVAPGSEEEVLARFRKTRAALTWRIQAWLRDIPI